MYRQQQKGFNLIESAIVLGVIGLVIGGIWIAAADIARTTRRNEIRATFLEMKTRIEQRWARMPYTGGVCGLYVCLTTSLFDPAQTFPVASVPHAAYWSVADYLYKSPSGLFYTVYGNGSNEFTTYQVGYLDLSDCLWFGMNIIALAPWGTAGDGGELGGTSAHLWLANAGGTDQSYYFDKDGFNTGTPMITWLKSSCENGATNILGVRVGRP